MKSLFLSLLCLCASLSASYSQEAEKIYVKISEILISDNSITVLVGNQIHEFSSLNVDEKGIFVLVSDKVDWRCGVCGKANNNDAQYCRHCGRW